ncbi:MAG: hypothetical protein D6698_12435 [Gammaproteobacteria bacterium]|nr:MAG: hypothetical protein D6698_12435 [Gammaproteobacteria bacterium]
MYASCKGHSRMKSSEYLNHIALEYSQYVLYSRAIPKMSDGLKPGQRIALWLVRRYDKSDSTVALVGEMISSRHYVHGNAPAEDLVSRLAAPYLMNYPLIHGEGAFGSRIAPIDGIGAARYTAVKRSDFAQNHLYVDEDILPFNYGYDGATRVPTTFLPLLPILLLNGAKGIAVGFACNILPRKIEDVSKAVLETIRTGKCNHPLLPGYERYDVDVVHLDDNKYQIIGKFERINASTIRITEIPPQTKVTKALEHLKNLKDEGKIRDFTNNSSDRISIEVSSKRGTFGKMDDAEIISLLNLSVVETENITTISPDGSRLIRYNTPQELVEDFVRWRLPYIKKRFEKKLDTAINELTRLLLFLSAFEKHDGKVLVNDIPKIRSRKELLKRIEVMNIGREIGATKEDMNWLADLPIHRFTKAEQKRASDRVQELFTKIGEYEDIISSEDRQREIYATDIKDRL